MTVTQPEHLNKVGVFKMTTSPSSLVMPLKYVAIPSYSQGYISSLPTILQRASPRLSCQRMIYAVVDTKRWLN